MEKLKPNKQLEFLSFKGTDYLGITQNEEFRTYLIEGFSKYGSSFGASRLSGSFSDIFEAAENRLAKAAGAEAALSFSSGTLSGIALINLLNKNNEFVYAPHTHPALLPPKHNKYSSFEEWESDLIHKYQIYKKPIVVFSNSVNPLTVEKYNFDRIKIIAENIPVTLIIDDSHGFGIIGNNGSGVFNELPNDDRIEKIVISSLGKAWGLPGGVVLASDKIINQLKKTSIFGGASPLIPAYLYAFLKSEHIYTENRTRIKKYISLFLNNIYNKNKFTFFKDFPVFATENHFLYDKLLKQNIEISSFSYPSPQDKRYTRIVLSAQHNEKDILKLCKAINNSQEY